MRRRDLLAALGSGAVAATAGCGYAHGGGDLRGEERISNSGLPSEEFFAVSPGRIAHATSGRQPVWNEDDVTLAEVTEVSAWTRAGERRWSHTHEASSRAVAVGDDVYVLDGSDQVVAIAATAVESERSTERDYETRERWRVPVEEAAPPLAANDGGAYLAREGGLSAVRDGTVAWELDLPGTPSSLCVLDGGDSDDGNDSDDGGVDGGVVVTTAEAVVALTADGRDRWRFETDGAAAVAAVDGRTAIRDEDGLAVLRTSDGRDPWSDGDLGRRGDEADDDRPTVTDDAVYVTVYGEVRALDGETGEQRWASGSSVGVDPPLVPAPEGVYVTGANCEAVAVGADRDGIRWSRTLDVQGSCRPVVGWVDGETVAFLFESGDLRWLQRTDQPAPGSV